MTDQAWWQAPLPDEPSLQPYLLCFFTQQRKPTLYALIFGKQTVVGENTTTVSKDRGKNRVERKGGNGMEIMFTWVFGQYTYFPGHPRRKSY